MTTWFAEEDGHVSVNSATGNRGGARTVYSTLNREPGDPVPKVELMELVFAETDERPPIDEMGFGQVTLNKHVAAQLAAMTRHDYSDQMVRRVVREFSFIKSVAGMAWSCVRSLDNGVKTYLNNRDSRGGMRGHSDQTSSSVHDGRT